jgi:hypothetical protein
MTVHAGSHADDESARLIAWQPVIRQPAIRHHNMIGPHGFRFHMLDQ